MKRNTQRIELVETQNLHTSLMRLQSSLGGYNSGRWRRALHHALAMSDTDWQTLKKLREALELP